MNYKYVFLALFGTLLVILVSSVPDSSLSGKASLGRQVITNFAHVPVYALLTFLWLKSFVRTRFGKSYFVIKWSVLAGLVFFAIFDEIHQSFIPGRSASLMDVGLDLIGILCGLGALKISRGDSAL